MRSRPIVGMAALACIAVAQAEMVDAGSVPAVTGDMPVDVEQWAAALPTRFRVHAVKNEPTYVEVVELHREGDAIRITGGAPAWAELAEQAVSVSADGRVAFTACPPGMDCDRAAMSAESMNMPAGFLATAGLLSALRQGRLAGLLVMAQAFGDRAVFCVPGELVGIAQPILDPCFDRQTGAALAHRHRENGAFDGPSVALDRIQVTIEHAADACLHALVPVCANGPDFHQTTTIPTEQEKTP